MTPTPLAESAKSLLERGCSVSRKIYTTKSLMCKEQARCLVTYKGKVYDLTDFLEDHPGGPELIEEFKGKDIAAAMADADSHIHSGAAYSLLDSFLVGDLAGPDDKVSSGSDDDGIPPDEGEKECVFLDLSRPLVMQIYRSKWTKEFYLQEVHKPKHLKGSARFFGPLWMEMLTRTPFFLVPIVWIPASLLMLYLSVQENETSYKWLPYVLYAIGNLVWSLVEYLFHRFIFHIEFLLPDNQASLMVHFLLHGVHHFLPMDKYRLVMPPHLFFALQYPFFRLLHVLIPSFAAKSLMGGVYSFYVVYDMMHYALHHSKMPRALTSHKTHHMEHHYREPNLGFGVSTPLWDHICGTTFPPIRET